MDRYALQVAFNRLGEEGQKRLRQARAAVVGLGALGGVCVTNLCRAGVGTLRFADNKRVELGNLPRQVLFFENDVKDRVYKTDAAVKRLGEMNSETRLEPFTAEINADNIGSFIDNADVVLDATDNMETRFIINEECFKRKLPWIYCGILGSRRMTANIIPGGPCLCCIMPPETMKTGYPTTYTDGVINMAAGVMASVSTAEAVKIITGSPDVRGTLMVMDLWKNTTDYISVSRDPQCPVCGRHGGKYELSD